MKFVNGIRVMISEATGSNECIHTYDLSGPMIIERSRKDGLIGGCADEWTKGKII